MAGLPLAPRGHGDRQRLQFETRILQRPADGPAPERVEERERVQVEHHLVGSRQQAGRAEFERTAGRRDAFGECVGEECLGRAAQRAVDETDPPAAEGVVDHLVHLHLVLRVGARLAVELDAEDQQIVGIPGAAGSVGYGWIVERGDTAAEGIDLLDR